MAAAAGEDPHSPWRDWIPCRVAWELSRPQIDWCYLGGARFTEPFFQGTIARALSRPFSATFLRRAPLDAFDDAGQADPSGLIFHMSRCGSTLLAQMLKAIPGVTVFSEPLPIDSIVRAPERGLERGSEIGMDVSPGQHAVWLRSMARALAHGAGVSRAYFLKLDCWHAVDLPLFRRAFPATPWIFLYRDPTEVLMSHASLPGEWTLPGYLQAARFGFDPATVAPAALAEYRTRLLAGMLRGILEGGAEWQGRLVNYAQIPEWGWNTLPQLFGLDVSADEIAAMQTVATEDAKRASLAFAPDAELKRADVPPEIRALSERYLDPLYLQLEALRRA